MKNLLHALLIALLVWPTIIPWLPHSAVHALHETHRSHQSTRADHGPVHGPAGHARSGHDGPASTALHHELVVSTADYLNDYLDADLASPATDRPITTAAVSSTSFTLVPPSAERVSKLPARGPPLHSATTPPRLPVYLSTQRLRI